MTLNKLLALFCALALSGAGAGCIGGTGSGGGTADRRGRSGRGMFSPAGKKRDAGGALASSSVSSPAESGAERDMRELQELERRQAELRARLSAAPQASGLPSGQYPDQFHASVSRSPAPAPSAFPAASGDGYDGYKASRDWVRLDGYDRPVDSVTDARPSALPAVFLP